MTDKPLPPERILSALRPAASWQGSVETRGTVLARATNYQGAVLYLVDEGELRLSLEDMDPVVGLAGDVLLVPVEMPHHVETGADTESATHEVHVADVLRRRSGPADRAVAVGKGDVSCRFRSTLSLWTPGAEVIARSVLPPLAHIRAGEPFDHGRLSAVLGGEKTEPTDPATRNSLVAAALAMVMAFCLRRQSQSRTGGLVARALALVGSPTSTIDSVADLAERLDVPQRQLTKAFREEAKLPPSAYIAHARLDRAAALLRANAGLSVQEICRSVGLSSVPSFTNAFTRRFGVSPTAYAAQPGSAPHEELGL